MRSLSCLVKNIKASFLQVFCAIYFINLNLFNKKTSNLIFTSVNVYSRTRPKINKLFKGVNERHVQNCFPFRKLLKISEHIVIGVPMLQFPGIKWVIEQGKGSSVCLSGSRMFYTLFEKGSNFKVRADDAGGKNYSYVEL